jgi:hypothetical protein
LTNQASEDTRSYFNLNAARVEQSNLASKSQAFKDLLISFLTIQQYRDLLFDPTVHLRNDLTDDFINNVMRFDFGQIILKLRDYAGNERKGVQEAYKYMDDALRELYKADDIKKDLVDAVMDCRGLLHSAYQQLEHLSQYF